MDAEWLGCRSPRPCPPRRGWSCRWIRRRTRRPRRKDAPRARRGEWPARPPTRSSEDVVVESPAGPGIIDNARVTPSSIPSSGVGSGGGAVVRARLGQQVRRAARDLPGPRSWCALSSKDRESAVGRRAPSVGEGRAAGASQHLAARTYHLSHGSRPPVDAFRPRRARVPPFQVWEWAARGAEGYDAMTNVPAGLREALGDTVPFSTLTVTGQQARDGTVKTLFRTTATPWRRC